MCQLLQSRIHDPGHTHFFHCRCFAGLRWRSSKVPGGCLHWPARPTCLAPSGPIHFGRWAGAEACCSSWGCSLCRFHHGHNRRMCGFGCQLHPTHRASLWSHETRLWPPLTRSLFHRHPTFGSASCHRQWDRAIVAQLMQPAPGAESSRAHLQLLQSSGAGAWLHAPPSEALGLHIVSPLFKVLVRMRLRMALVVKDLPCPLCDGIADRFWWTMLACVRAVVIAPRRHHRLRSAGQGSGFEPRSGTGWVAAAATRGAWRSRGWLQPWARRPEAGRCVGAMLGLARTPPLIWPSPVVFKQGHAAVAAADGGRAAVYEGRKNQRLQTLTTCKDFFL